MTLPPPVSAFLDAVGRRDTDAVLACFTEDATYAYAVPLPELSGRQAIDGMFRPLLEGAERVQWDVVSTVQDGERVWVERVDRFWYDGREVPIECTGLFELDGERIRSVRDYCDLQTYRSRKEGA